MPAPNTPTGGDSLLRLLAFESRIAVRRPGGGPVAAVPVDDELVWLAPAPAVALGAARRSSPAALVHLHVQLAQEHAAAHGEALEAALAGADIIEAAARAVAGYLDDLPDLPLVGEPFGGEEGTD